MLQEIEIGPPGRDSWRYAKSADVLGRFEDRREREGTYRRKPGSVRDSLLPSGRGVVLIATRAEDTRRRLRSGGSRGTMTG